MSQILDIFYEWHGCPWQTCFGHSLCGNLIKIMCIYTYQQMLHKVKSELSSNTIFKSTNVLQSSQWLSGMFSTWVCHQFNASEILIPNCFYNYFNENSWLVYWVTKLVLWLPRGGLPLLIPSLWDWKMVASLNRKPTCLAPSSLAITANAKTYFINMCGSMVVTPPQTYSTRACAQLWIPNL